MIIIVGLPFGKLKLIHNSMSYTLTTLFLMCNLFVFVLIYWIYNKNGYWEIISIVVLSL